MANYNRVIELGRLTADPRLSTTPSGKSVASFTIAVNRLMGEGADFPNCVAWDKTAEFISRYFHKGDLILIEGSLRTGKYEKNGEVRYTTDVNVERAEFGESKKSASSQDVPTDAPALKEIKDDDELPY